MLRLEFYIPLQLSPNPRQTGNASPVVFIEWRVGAARSNQVTNVRRVGEIASGMLTGSE